MNKYRVMPNNGIDYFVYADEVEFKDGWAIFYTIEDSENELLINRIFFHSCSSNAVQWVHLVVEKENS